MVTKVRVQTAAAPAAVAAYSQGLKVGNLLFTAGQVGLDPKTGDLVEAEIGAQTRRALENLSAILAAAGATLDNVVKTSVFLSDMANFAHMNEVYRQYFNSDAPPARTTVQVAALPLGAMVEIDCVAVLDDAS